MSSRQPFSAERETAADLPVNDQTEPASICVLDDRQPRSQKIVSVITACDLQPLLVKSLPA
jgi:hypothetical protein